MSSRRMVVRFVFCIRSALSVWPWPGAISLIRTRTENLYFVFGEVVTARRSRKLPSLRISGQTHAESATTTFVSIHPLTTENTGPKNPATVPDSKPPSSLEALMNTLLTAETRPRISLGVPDCTRLWRTTTLTLSAAPLHANISNDNQNHVDRPKTMVTTPNAATASSNARPARRSGGTCDNVTAMQNAPTAGAARSHPNPVGPT